VQLVQTLFDGPIDIVGDVHGELDALRDLLHQLDYSPAGLHPAGRRLVFLGDLTDRGPDSPGVVDLVAELVRSGAAQCVLGNHELNILLGHKKLNNDWFFGQPFVHEGRTIPQVLADDVIRAKVVDFFRTLPLVLERPGLRVVHACWRSEMVDVARQASDFTELYHRYAGLIDEDNRRSDRDEIDRKLALQNRNPVKVLTSGIERRTHVPFMASGELRNEERVVWWYSYADPELCVFGHYSLPPSAIAKSGRAICIDFGVARRWQERIRANFAGNYVCRLAALRFPEKVLVFDDGGTFRMAVD
jgi:hypothetical protein